MNKSRKISEKCFSLELRMSTKLKKLFSRFLGLSRFLRISFAIALTGNSKVSAKGIDKMFPKKKIAAVFAQTFTSES
jgi:hypothetical protein